MLYSYKCEQKENAHKNKFPENKQLVPRRNPMIISDLNYLENTSEEIFGGYAVNFGVVKNVGATVNQTYTQNTTSNANITGYTAIATGVANATGNATFTSSIGGTSTTVGSSQSFIELVSASK